MTREDMICSNCMNGEQRVVGDSQIIKCFLNPEVVVKAGFERCASGQWESSDSDERCVYYWGDI